MQQHHVYYELSRHDALQITFQLLHTNLPRDFTCYLTALLYTLLYCTALLYTLRHHTSLPTTTLHYFKCYLCYFAHFTTVSLHTTHLHYIIFYTTLYYFTNHITALFYLLPIVCCITLHTNAARYFTCYQTAFF